MKKIVVLVFILFMGLQNINSQNTSYGITTGYQSTVMKIKFLGLSQSQGFDGFFVGLFADYSISDKFSIQPEVHFSQVYNDGESLDELMIPVMVKYYVNDKLYLQSGPFLDYIIEESEGFDKFGFGLGIGAGYNINDKLFASIRYSFGLNQRLTVDLVDDFGSSITSSDVSTKLNFLQIGVGYRF